MDPDDDVGYFRIRGPSLPEAALNWAVWSCLRGLSWATASKKDISILVQPPQGFTELVSFRVGEVMENKFKLLRRRVAFSRGLRHHVDPTKPAEA